MTVLAWAGAAWLAVAVPAALAIGRAIHIADQHHDSHCPLHH